MVHPQTSETCSRSTLSELQSVHLHETVARSVVPCWNRLFKVLFDTRVRLFSPTHPHRGGDGVPDDLSGRHFSIRLLVQTVVKAPTKGLRKTIQSRTLCHCHAHTPLGWCSTVVVSSSVPIDGTQDAGRGLWPRLKNTCKQFNFP